jgi:glycosyltransferase involved in cell wall biosynthesis
MRILASPARRNKDKNPFNFLLSEALAGQGCEVVDLDHRNGFSAGWDVIHIHWPQQTARGPLPNALKRTLILAAHLLVQRLRGAHIVWTVHNVHGHDQNNPALERALMWFVVRLLHGVIFLSESSRQEAYAGLPALAAKPSAVIPHGVYGRRSEKSRAGARAGFGLPSNGFVVGFLGDIKPYKGLDRLLDAVAETAAGQVTLFVAGAFQDADYGARIRARVGDLAASGHAIVFREERLDDAALVDAIRASDIVALPYVAISNSGLALLVLENQGRILASDAPVFRELERELGAEFVQVVGARFSGADLMAAAGKGSDEATRRMEAFCEARSWPEIGAKTVGFYRQLGAGVRAGAGHG